MTDQFNGLVAIERQRQDDKWGEQNHSAEIWTLILGEEFGELTKEVLEHWSAGIARSGNIEDELIQVAAVCKVMFESGKRNGWL